MSRWQEPHLRGVAILCALSTAAVLVLHACSVHFRRVENQVGDLVRQLTPRAKADPRLVYVALDDSTMNVSSNVFPDDLAASPTLQKMASGWPWPRDVHAMIIDRLMQAGAKVVALDILFPTPREGDPALKAVLDKYKGRVVIGSNFADEETPGAPRSLTNPASDLIANGETDDRVGYVNFWPDYTDGVIRTTRYQRKESDAFQVADHGRVFYSLGARVLQKLDSSILIPSDLRGLRFAQTVGPESFQPIPIYMLFVPKAWKENFKNGAAFKDKVVLIGPYGNSLKDQLPTPYGMMDGPLIHLNAINDALHDDFVSVPSEQEIVLLIIALGFGAFGLASIMDRPVVLAVTLLAFSTAYFGVVFGLDYFHRGLPFLAPLLTFDAGSALSLYWKWLLERKERSRMRRMFERFVSKDVVKEVVENRESFLHQLGGVRKHVAIMMTDLRNFTTMTEDADSTQLVAQLNEYFDAMVSCVFDTRGTVDKFVGDAILAVWGNIHSGGPGEDAARAVQTALEMLKALDKLNREWPSRGWPVLKMGIGINFGEVIFGAIGSEQKAEPTVIGDAVNSASRLEGLTKEYGLDMLIGEAVAELVRDSFHLQLIDYVRVKGKSRAMKVYAVLGPRSEALDARTVSYLEKYEIAIAGYARGEFDIACSQFREVLETKPDDPVATVYFERCAELAEQRPKTWDGVFVMKSK